MKAYEHDTATNEITSREMSGDEVSQYEREKDAYLAITAEMALLATERAAAKQAVLDKLGLTADEVTALLG